MLNRSILTELAALEARFEAGCVVCIDLIDSCDNVVYNIRGLPRRRDKNSLRPPL